MNSLIIVLAIIISIAISHKTKINMGFFALAFAYIIGCFVLNITAPNLIAMWPISVFFVILATSLFYNFAVVNGTLEKLSGYILYSCRKAPLLLPFAIFLTSTVIAGLGAGYFSVMVLITPIAILLAKKSKMDTMICALASNYGAMIGASFMISANGVVYRSLIEAGGYGNSSFSFATGIFIVSLLIPVILLSGLIIYTKRSNKIVAVKNAQARLAINEVAATSDVIGNLEIQKPEPFNKKQKINLYLIIIMVITVLVPPILHIITPKNPTFTFINSKVDIGLIAIVFTVIAAMLKLADEKKVIAKVPWSTLLMIAGVGMLISVAVKAGTIKLLSGWVSGNLSPLLVPIALCIIGAIMTFFSSLIGVVIPALFPIVPAIAHATGLNPMLLYICIVIGAQSATISPFSAGGAMVMGYSETDEEREQVFKKELFRALPGCFIAAVIMTVIISIIIK